jgi:DinB family protein
MVLDEVTDQINALRTRAQQLVSGLTSDQLTRRPEPSKWSITECLAHLNLTAAVVQPKIAEAIERGRQEKIEGKGPFAPGAFGRLLLWVAEPPPKFRMRAPKNIAPQVAHGNPDQVVADFMKFQDGWEKLIRDCEGLDQEKIKVAPLFAGLPRLRLAAPIPWMLAHQRRHLAQAENVKRQITHPASAARA